MNKERKIVSTSLPMIQKEKVPFACVCVWERERERERFRFWGGGSWGPKTWGSLNVHLMYEVSPCWSFHVQRERERERSRVDTPKSRVFKMHTSLIRCIPWWIILAFHSPIQNFKRKWRLPNIVYFSAITCCSPQ